MHHNGNACLTSRHPSRPVHMNRKQFPALLLAFAAVANGGVVNADEQREFFEKKIRPVLVEHCYECHSIDSDEAGGKLLVDSRDGMLVGGESGPVLLAGQPDASLIIQALRYDDLEMPPDAPLPEAVINDFVKWISLGAADPRPDGSKRNVASTDDTESVWSFLPRRLPTVPAVQNRAWPRDSIDHFVLARLEQAALAPTHDADPRSLVRRLYYDLIGLPPTREQVDSFVDQYGKRHSKRRSEVSLTRCSRVLNSVCVGDDTGSILPVMVNPTETMGWGETRHSRMLGAIAITWSTPSTKTCRTIDFSPSKLLETYCPPIPLSNVIGNSSQLVF